MSDSGGSGRPRRITLDTSAYARLRAGDREVHEFVGAAEVVFVPTVVLGELRAGFLLGRRGDENRRVLADFLAEPFTKVVDVTEDVGNAYARIFVVLRRAGTPIPTNDIWIAASSVVCRGHLISFDTDYLRVPGLECTVLSVTQARAEPASRVR